MSAVSLSRILPSFRNFSANAIRSWKITDLLAPGYQRVVAVNHAPSKLNAIVAIHNTNLGPALGGLRILPYRTFEDAITDVKRLAVGMSYKSALAGVGTGGGKSVIISDPKDVTEEMLKVYAAFLNHLEGVYITGEDSGSTGDMMDFIGQHTPYVTALSHPMSSGNPSPFTAWGVYRAIQATCKVLNGSDSIEGKTIAIQGLGNVGALLAELLFWQGAKLMVADIDPAKTAIFARKYSAISCSPQDIHRQECDIFAPCALGGILNSQTIPQLQCKAVAGCANNQLLEDSDAVALQRRGILYATDFVGNAGGLISSSDEFYPNGFQSSRARNGVDKIYHTMMEIFLTASEQHITTHEAAVSIAEFRMSNKIGQRTEPAHFHHFEDKKLRDQPLL